MIKLNQDYWSNRYNTNEIGWDVGYISTPIKEYVDQLKNKDISILIPGAGNSYEAEYIYKAGFKNIHLLDFAKEPLVNFKTRVPDFNENNLHHQDFFAHYGQYDLIIEQTFFCAIEPSLRAKYVAKMYELLVPKGRLVGLLFNDELNKDHPPFGGNKTEYLRYFEPLFEINKMELAYNSISPRANRELFINLEKKKHIN